jgi:hypothetical protein
MMRRIFLRIALALVCLSGAACVVAPPPGASSAAPVPGPAARQIMLQRVSASAGARGVPPGKPDPRAGLLQRDCMSGAQRLGGHHLDAVGHEKQGGQHQRRSAARGVTVTGDSQPPNSGGKRQSAQARR